LADVSYAGSPFAVREDLAAAHARAWQRLAAPGTWWTGAERVAIAAEVRAAARCRACRERQKALSPAAVSTPHDAASALPEPAVDAVHRIASDPARLGRGWFEKLAAAGLSDAHYVELLGVVASVVSVDAFCRGIGVPPHPLPEPRAGEPSRRRPAAARLDVAWVPMLPADAARGELADLWARGRSANVIRALSLVPDEVRGLRDLSAAHYLAFDRMMDLRAGRALDRMQIELVAGRVSALRECFY
jgi:hypothetical protein